MAVNPFTKPTQIPEYPRLYVNRPTKLERNVATKLAQQYDTAKQLENERRKIIQNAATSPFPEDQKLAQQIADHYAEREKIRQQRGDYERMLPDVRQDATEAMSKVKPIKRQAANYQDFLKKLEELEDRSPEYKEQWKNALVREYQENQGGLDWDPQTLDVTGGFFQGQMPAKEPDMAKMTSDFLSDVESDKIESVKVPRLNPRTGKYERRTVSVEGVSEEELKNIARLYIQQQPEVQAYLQDKTRAEMGQMAQEDVDRALQMYQQPVENEDGEVETDDEGNPVTYAETLGTGPGEPTVEEQIQTRMETQNMSEEQAKAATFQDLRQKELTSTAIGAAAPLHSFRKVEQDIDDIAVDRQDAERGNIGSIFDRARSKGLVNIMGMNNPYMNPDWTETNPATGRKEFKPETKSRTKRSMEAFIGREDFWKEYKNFFSPGLKGVVDRNKAMIENIEVFEPITASKRIFEAIGEAATSEDEAAKYTEDQKKLISRALTTAALTRDDVTPEDVQNIDPNNPDSDLQRKILNDAIDILSNISTINATGYQPADRKVLKNMNERLLKYGQYSDRKAHLMRGDGVVTRDKTFDHIWKNQLGMEKTPQKALEDGDAVVSGIVGPDSGITPLGLKIEVPSKEGGTDRSIIVDAPVDQKFNYSLQYKVNQAKNSLKPVNLSIPEDISSLDERGQKLMKDMDLEEGKSYTLQPVPARDENGNIVDIELEILED